jgi:hypothetical protein
MASASPITVSLSFGGLTLEGAHALISASRNIEKGSASAEVETDDAETIPTPRKRGRPSKAELAARAAEEETEDADEPEETEDADVEEEPEADADDETEDEPEEDEKPKARKGAVAGKLTLEKHVIPAFQAFVKKHDREKAVKVLAKFKVKSVRDLPASKFEDVIKALR